MNYTILTTTEMDTLITNHSDWVLSVDRSSVNRQFKFPNFISAMVFMNECAHFAESINHHPNWSNVYNKVDVLLTTNAKKCLTDLDRDMVVFMDAVFNEMVGK